MELTRKYGWPCWAFVLVLTVLVFLPPQVPIAQELDQVIFFFADSVIICKVVYRAAFKQDV